MGENGYGNSGLIVVDESMLDSLENIDEIDIPVCQSQSSDEKDQ